jgi:hypothetical protein
LLIGGFLMGCGRVQEDFPGTGAKQCVLEFYQALIQQDWPSAYATLDPRNQKAHTPEQFSRLAQSFRGTLGFEPESIHIQACQEHGPEAMAHVVLTGRNADQERRFKDAVALRRGDEGWRITLPATFGRVKKR